VTIAMYCSLHDFFASAVLFYFLCRYIHVLLMHSYKLVRYIGICLRRRRIYPVQCKPNGFSDAFIQMCELTFFARACICCTCIYVVFFHLTPYALLYEGFFPIKRNNNNNNDADSDGSCSLFYMYIERYCMILILPMEYL
jgi:hypothetical protein